MPLVLDKLIMLPIDDGCDISNKLKKEPTTLIAEGQYT